MKISTPRVIFMDMKKEEIVEKEVDDEDDVCGSKGCNLLPPYLASLLYDA